MFASIHTAHMMDPRSYRCDEILVSPGDRNWMRIRCRATCTCRERQLSGRAGPGTADGMPHRSPGCRRSAKRRASPDASLDTPGLLVAARCASPVRLEQTRIRAERARTHLAACLHRGWHTCRLPSWIGRVRRRGADLADRRCRCSLCLTPARIRDKTYPSGAVWR